MDIQQSLGYLLNTCARCIKRKLDIEIKHYNITTSQWAVLKLLFKENRLSQAEIAEKTNMDRATCGTIIDKLISKELVQKELCENDRRSYIVKILPGTFEIINEVSILAEDVNQVALDGLSDSDIDNLHNYLITIINNLDRKDM
ncbi:MarR family winged helix-turn-helix transcriptional regulator [Miniphocaeibacter massiliensis]|uniref:MarR family winged helix-turn-helix transcriptional regulator n=1 Tax=Miniphocaeibacter massiliensis TaxID=2041841 RepID=UPI000C1BF4AB|nr:MarR family transcriptional regulator [Miniphocaeibacter massiliensis]